MNNLKAKLKKQGGFTLIEMLIVVAIIAILIAVSIPMVNTALESAREATDEANHRSAIALATVGYMTFEPGSTDATNSGISTDGVAAAGCWYSIDDEGNGRLSSTEPSAYGKGKADIGRDPDAHDGEALKITIGTDDTIIATWTTVS